MNEPNDSPALPESLREQVLDILDGPDGESERRLERLIQAHSDLADQISRVISEHRRMLGRLQDESMHAEDPCIDLPRGDGPDEQSDEEQEGRYFEPRLRYKIRNRIAIGGMGEIWKVWDPNIRRKLAIKVIRGEQITRSHPTDRQGDTADPPIQKKAASLSRFLEEAQITGQLDHPGVVPVHVLGPDDAGRFVFSMRLIRGRTLSAIYEDVWAGRDGWTITRSLEVFLKICDTLAYAHSKNVIHRDIKPANIMVGRFGETYVMDWGLAKVLGREDSHDLRIRPDETLPRSEVRTDRSEEVLSTPDSPIVTLDGTVVGTPCYMPPEQAKGLVEELGPTSDVYSIGAMLYELLAGRMPYVEPGAHVSPRLVLHVVMERPPKPLDQIKPDIPAELVAIVEKAMARERRHRYQGVVELASDLRAFLDHRVVSAYRTGAFVEMMLWIRRNRVLAATLAIACLVVVAGSLATLVQYWRAEASLSLANERARQLADETRRARSSKLVAQALERSHVDPGLGLLLAQEAHDRGDPDARAAVQRNLALLHERARFTTAGDVVLDAVVTERDGVAMALSSGRLIKRTFHNDTEPRVHAIVSADVAAFSPSGDLLGLGTSSRLSVVDTRTGEQLWERGFTDREWRFSEDGRWVHGEPSRRSHGHVEVMRARTGEPVVLAASEPSIIHVAVNGSTLLATTEEASRAYRIPEGELIATWPHQHGRFYDAAVSPSGFKVLVAHEWHAAVIDLETERSIELAVAKYPHGARFLTDEQVVIHSTATGTGVLLPLTQVFDAVEGRELFRLSQQEAFDGTPVLKTSVLDYAVLCADHTIRLVDDEGRLRGTLEGHAHDIVEAGSVEGTELLWSRDVAGTVIVWSLGTADCHQVHGYGMDHAEASPTGRYLAVSGRDWGGNGTVFIRDMALDKEVLRTRASDQLDCELSALSSMTWPNDEYVELCDGRGRRVRIHVDDRSPRMASIPEEPTPEDVRARSSRGGVVAVAEDEGLVVRRSSGGAELLRLARMPEGVLLFSGDESHLILRGRDSLSVWQWHREDPVGVLRLSENERFIGAWGSQCVISRETSGRGFSDRLDLWQAASDRPIHLTEGVPVNLSQTAVRDGMLIVAAGREVRAYDLASNTWVGHWTTQVGRYASSADDKVDWAWNPSFNRQAGLVTIVVESLVHVWPIDPVVASRRALLRTFTLQELSAYDLEPTELTRLAHELLGEGTSPEAMENELRSSGASARLISATHESGHR